MIDDRKEVGVTQLWNFKRVQVRRVGYRKEFKSAQQF